MRKLICTMLVLILLSCLAFGCKADEAKLPPKDENGFYILPKATFEYNLEKENGIIADIWPSLGYFEEPLDEAEISRLTPDDRFSCTGTAGWEGTGEPYSVDISFKVDGEQISVIYNVRPGEYWVNPNLKTTECNNVQFIVKQIYDDDGITEFVASGFLGSQFIKVQAKVLKSDPEVVRAAFEIAVRWMSIGNAMNIDATTVQYAEIPEFFSLNLEPAEAYADPTFGHMLPRNLPADFHQGNIVRFKNYHSDYLSVRWDHNTYESQSIFWKVSRSTDKDKNARIPSEQVSPETIKGKISPVLKLEDITIEILEALHDQREFRIIAGEYTIFITSNADPKILYELLQQVC